MAIHLQAKIDALIDGSPAQVLIERDDEMRLIVSPSGQNYFDGNINGVAEISIGISDILDFLAADRCPPSADYQEFCQELAREKVIDAA